MATTVRALTEKARIFVLADCVTASCTPGTVDDFRDRAFTRFNHQTRQRSGVRRLFFPRNRLLIVGLIVLNRKAVTKIYKRKLAERDEAHQASMLPGHTPTALPDLHAYKLPEVPRFQPLEPPAISSGRQPSVRASNRRRSDNVVQSEEPSSRTRHASSARSSHNS